MSSRTCAESSADSADTRESGRGLGGVLLDMRPAIRSWIAFAFASRSDMDEIGGSTGVWGPLSETERLESVVFEGEGGGGIAIALGSLARGVLLKDGRDLLGVVAVGMPIPKPVGLAEPNAFGVLKGDPGALRVGEESCRDGCIGEPNPVDLVGLTDPAPRAGLLGVPESCFAVIPTYFAAREPGVMFVGAFVFLPGVTRVRVVVAEGRGRAAGVE